MEKRFNRKDGEIVWTNVTASLQRDAAGQPAYCIAIVQDVSERKRLEAELTQAHARLELAVRGSNVRIWDVDMPDGEFQNGRMFTVNFWEHLGYGPETQAETTTAVSVVAPRRSGAGSCLSRRPCPARPRGSRPSTASGTRTGRTAGCFLVARSYETRPVYRFASSVATWTPPITSGGGSPPRERTAVPDLRGPCVRCVLPA